MKLPQILKTALIILALTSFHSSFAQDIKIKFFGQPGLDYAYNRDAKQGSPYFRAGQFVMFVTSQVNDRVSVSGEVNFHNNVADPEPAAEIERIYLRYLINDNLAIRVGKTYNPLGFWNLNYNLGLVLQPTITRPTLLQPNHDGGFTQTRDTGIMLEGEDIGKSRLFFRIFLANGAGKNGGTSGNSYALGKTIAATAQIGFEPIEGLKISASGLANELDPGTDNQFGVPITEDILYTAQALSISYLNPSSKLELISEYYSHNHHYETLGNYAVRGGMIYLGYRASDRITPYLFGENINYSGQDPFYPAVNRLTGQGFVNTINMNVGLRYKFSPNIILKVEGGYSDQKIYGTTLMTKTQLAFSF